MNANTPWKTTKDSQLLEELLVDVGVKIQLSPTMHDKAVGHYEAINRHLDRPESPLRGRISLFYPQGSMAIGATIRSRDDEDLFDIDLVAEMDMPDAAPAEMLDQLFVALKGEVGSKYHDRVRRQTRCVTVDYADMHLDITPMQRMADWADRGGLIAHAHESDPPQKHHFVEANPWGFVEWFNDRVPKDQWFSQMILEKSFRDAQELAKAEADPVPDHEQIYAKALAVVALQLFKRWARLNHERNGGQGRCLPSVALSFLFATNSGNTGLLADELIHQASQLRDHLLNATIAGELIDLRNPALESDRFTDRWPENLTQQLTFANDVADFVKQMVAAKNTQDIRQLQGILVGLFGEKTTKAVVSEFYERGGVELGAGRSSVATGSGMTLAGLATGAAVASVPSPSHRFFGG